MILQYWQGERGIQLKIGTRIRPAVTSQKSGEGQNHEIRVRQKNQVGAGKEPGAEGKHRVVSTMTRLGLKMMDFVWKLM